MGLTNLLRSPFDQSVGFHEVQKFLQVLQWKLTAAFLQRIQRKNIINHSEVLGQAKVPRSHDQLLLVT